jgi:enoyl-CoA hydratase
MTAIELERQGAVAVAYLRAGKANAINTRLLDALAAMLDDVERGDATSLVITGDGKAFSAGLALPELIELDRPHMAALMDHFERTMRRVLAFPHATVAAINGHAFAGGCVLALMCDARVMAAGDARIGLNEAQLGVGLPAAVIEPLRLRVGPAAYTPIALEGRLFSPADAVGVQLVDEVVAPDALMTRAIERAGVLGGAPIAYAQIKRALLAPVLAELDRRRAAEADAWLDTWFSPLAQRTLRAAVDRITKR